MLILISLSPTFAFVDGVKIGTSNLSYFLYSFIAEIPLIFCVASYVFHADPAK